MNHAGPSVETVERLLKTQGAHCPVFPDSDSARESRRPVALLGSRKSDGNGVPTRHACTPPEIVVLS